MSSPARLRSPILAAVALAPLVALGCSSCAGAGPAVKANGCTATVTGHSAGRAVVTYSNATHDPNMLPAIEQAVSRWNSSGVHVLLQGSANTATITFLATTAATHTDPCKDKKARTINVYLNSKKFASGGTANEPLPDLVAREIGHALGLAKAGPCGALMTTACKKIPPGPDAAEIAEVNRLYPAG